MKLSHVSASQISKFRECPRKWAQAYLFQNREPETEPMRMGTAIHKAVEDYLHTGIINTGPWEGLVAAVAPLVPVPGSTPLMVEHEFYLETYEGAPQLKGFVDLGYKLGELVCIDDWKSKGYLTKFLLTPGELSRDVQLTIYAKYLFSVTKVDCIRLRHIYVVREAPFATKPVEVLVTRANIELLWAETVETIKEMAAWAEKEPKTPEELPAGGVPGPYDSICEKYRGCYYKPNCWGSNELDIMFALESNNQDTTKGERMGLLDKVKADREKEAAAGAVVAGILPPDAPPRDGGPAFFAAQAAEKSIEAAREAQAAEAASPKKRGRAKKEPAEPGASDSTHEEGCDLVAGTGHPLVYVDCLPSKSGPITTMEDWLRPLQEGVARANNKPDFRMIEYIHIAKGQLAAAIDNHVGTLPDRIFVSSHHDMASLFLERVVPLAIDVIRKAG